MTSSPNATLLRRGTRPRSGAGEPPCQKGLEIPPQSQIARSCTTSEHWRRVSIEFYALGPAAPPSSLCLSFCYVLGTCLAYDLLLIVPYLGILPSISVFCFHLFSIIRFSSFVWAQLACLCLPLILSHFLSSHPSLASSFPNFISHD